jgi:hypothetical protein
VATAFEWTKSRDYDKDVFRGDVNAPAADQTQSAKGITSESKNQTSFVFIEAIRDHYDSHSPFNGTMQEAAHGTKALSFQEQVARTVIHEIGHQLNIAAGPGVAGEHRPGAADIMNAGTHSVPVDLFDFHSDDVNVMRQRMKSPGDYAE